MSLQRMGAPVEDRSLIMTSKTFAFALAVVVCLAVILSVRITAEPLPSGWVSRDIGSVGQPGSASQASGTFTVSGSGAGISGSADTFHFAYRTLTGDGTIVAEVASVTGAQPWTKVGVMMRASTQPNAAHAMAMITTARGLGFLRRATTGGLSAYTAGTGSAPRWVRLRRAGSTVTAAVSADGTAWTTLGSATISLPQTALVGLAVTSHDNTRLATGTFERVAVTAAPASSKPWAKGRLEVAPNGRMLRHATTGTPFFYLADTPWGMFKRLNRADTDLFLRDAAEKGFNAVQVATLWNWNTPGAGARNAYGDHPFVAIDNRYDPSRVVTTPGNDPADPVAYDYWDHIDYVLDRAEHYGLYVTLQPTWGNYVSGTNSYALDMSSNIFTVGNARPYGQFIGRRYARRPNIIWMLGGDRSAVYPNGDFRAVWRSMAEGVGRGITGQALVWNQPHAAWNQFLMTYHATRRNNPGSSIWFHNDAWLDFNSIQAEYHNITAKLPTDWNKTPTKPTAIIETRYEDELSTDRIVFTGAFKQRYQMYHSVLAGSLGYVYGHGRIWDLKTTDKTWQTALNDPGRLSIKTVWQLLNKFSNADLLNRTPDQTLLDGSLGSGTTEDLLVAMRGGDRRFAVVYSTNGRDIRFRAAQLATGTADAYWFSPRTGRYYNGAGSEIAGRFTTAPTGTGAAPATVFNPPRTAAAGNDWILILRVR